MYIQKVLLQTNHLADQKRFYCTTLGLTLLHETADSFIVQSGTTQLSFQETQEDVPPYHVAFTIPRNMFLLAKNWLSQRAPLLRKGGEDEIFFENINARSLYFCDAATNILELIAHYNLDYEAAGAFGPKNVLRVSEIGLPVGDVLALAATLKEQFAIESYPVASPISEIFAYLGDIYGQLVVVNIGRPWLPTDTVLSAVAPVQFTIEGQAFRRFDFAPHPYIMSVVVPDGL